MEHNNLSDSAETKLDDLIFALARGASSIGFSPDGDLLAIGQANGIALYDPASGKKVHPFKRTPAPVPSLAFHPRQPAPDFGRRFRSRGQGLGRGRREVKLRDPTRFQPECQRRRQPRRPAHCVARPRPCGGRPYGESLGRGLGRETYTEFRTLKGHVGYVWKVAFSPDGRYLASGSWDSTIKVWDLEAPESAEPVTLRGHAGFIQGLAFSPDGRRLASGSGYAGHGEVKVWDATLWENEVERGTLDRCQTGHRKEVCRCSSPSYPGEAAASRWSSCWW